ncbi:hypothetical protein P885DRAFT_78514 [Corynascus similis CBS 632.67]
MSMQSKAYLAVLPIPVVFMFHSGRCPLLESAEQTEAQGRALGKKESLKPERRGNDPACAPVAHIAKSRHSLGSIEHQSSVHVSISLLGRITTHHQQSPASPSGYSRQVSAAAAIGSAAVATCPAVPATLVAASTTPPACVLQTVFAPPLAFLLSRLPDLD